MPRTVSPPRVPAALTALDLDAGTLHDEADLEAVEVHGAGGDGLDARGVTITAAHLRDVVLINARLPHLRLRDCRLSGGSLANVTVRGGTAERCAFERVRLTGLGWQEGTLRDVRFRGCRIDLGSFAATRLERVVFEDCLLTEADLQDARLAAVIFDGCDLSRCDFTGARLSAGCVLRGCVLEGARSLERLRGAAMPVQDVVASAAVFATALGIVVEREQDTG